jgi:hypothetical protein
MYVLLSGFIAAVTAGFITVVYHYLIERSSQRAEVFAEIVSYFDDLVGRLIDMKIDKNEKFVGGKPMFTDEEYVRNSREITKKLRSSAPSAKLTFVYGEGKELAMFKELWGEIRKVSGTLRKAQESTWVKSAAEIDNSFHNIIDPLRRSLERRLLVGTRINAIAWQILAASVFNVVFHLRHPLAFIKKVVERLKTS